MSNIRNAIFGQTIECACGRTHQIQPRQIIYADDALAQLPGVCSRCVEGRSVVILMDERTCDVAGAEAARELLAAGWDVRKHVLPDAGPSAWPICDDATRRRLDGLAGEVAMVVAVGAGTVNDLAKWLAFDEGRPYVALATAASMNGYTSANVAPSIEGVKTLLRAKPPEAVLVSPRILAEAPQQMTAAGLGDVLAKSVSSADWYLNHLLFDDYYCQRSVELIARIEPLYLARPEDVRDRKGQAIEALFDALLLTGAAMTMADTSAPASGGEHVISHTLDMMSALDGQGHDLHGRQVGVGTILASEIWRRVLAVESPKLAEPATHIDGAFWGRLAGPVAKAYAEKLPRLRAASDLLAEPGRWDSLRSRLAHMLRPPERIADCLARAGAACRAEHIGCTPERLGSALDHAHEMRPRFTILDLARLVGVMDQAAGDIVDRCR